MCVPVCQKNKKRIFCERAEALIQGYLIGLPFWIISHRRFAIV